MTFEEEYEDVLHNIEFEIVRVYRSNASMFDYDAEEALEALIVRYKNEQQGRSPREPRLGERGKEVYQAIHEACEWRLGRQELMTEDGESIPINPEPMTLDQIIACLQRIRKSLQRWSREGGRQGYLKFISQFIE